MPNGFVGNISFLTFKSGIAQRLLHNQAQKVLKKAVREWVQTAEVNIPVWSGMSRGTLVKLGQQVGVNISLFVAPGANPPKGPGDRSSQGRNQSDGRLVVQKGRYGFVYKSDVFHLAVNENADATVYGFKLKQPGPYQFRQAANNAFTNRMNAELRSFPFNLIIGRSFDVQNQRVG